MRKKILSVWGCLAAASAVAETPLLSEFVQGTVAESVPVRLEARMGSLVAGKVVTGKVAIPSSDGVSSKEWDTSSVANGWTEVTDGDEKASLLVLNPPGYAVEGGRITANTSWSANAVHWVRNWVVVPSGVTLTVKEGTIVKFGEQTGIKVEDGGTVDFQGKSDNRIVLTHFADDVYGGDSDFGKTNAWYGAWSVTSVTGGTVNDTYTHVRYGKIESLPTISMPASVTAQRVEGKARIPVTLSGTRSNRMSLHWRTIDGTAKFGTDFSKNEDEAIWSNTSVETVYFEIPLIKTTDDDEVKTFRVEVLSTEDVNPNPERLVTTVTIISGTSVPIAKCVESGESMAIRLENREVDAVGRALVHGVEQKASDPNSAAVAWDTTKEPEGWQTLTAGESSAKVLVRNDAKVAIEGGRLTANTRWDSSAVHLVRNRVIVPAGVTLTIGEGAIVKFCEQTGIKVEDGGALVTEGKEKNRAVLTAIADDEFGGDSDLQEAQPVNYSWSIETVGSGSVSDVYTYVRYGTVSTLPTISMPTSVTAQRSDGKVRIPVTLSGTRANRMSIHWRAVDGTAKFGVDYSEKEGEAYWANTSTTTVYFEIPIIKENESEEVKTFDVELISAEDINIDPLRLVTKVMIVSGSAVPVAKCAESEASAAVRLENRSAETVGRALVRGVELKAPAPAEAAATWDTTQEPEGWNTLMATSGEPPATAKVLVRNAADIAFEGGRLEASAKWTGDAVHIVRNMVVVPSGITLTVAEGTVVKFAEATGIKVEDGGKLSLEGKDKARSVLTSLADDEFGGDTDLVETNGVYGSWSVETVGSGEVSDVYTYIRYGTIAPLPTISMPVSATAQRMDGKVRIPVTFSGTRSNRVAIHWRTNDGTAKYGVDFPENAGEAVWANTSTTTVFLEIPITKECDTDEVRTFQVELVSAEDINIDPSRLVTTVTIVSGAKVPMPTCAVSESSAAMRMEARSTNSLGRAAVVGTEWKAKDGGSRAEEWDTTPLGYGWQTLEDGHGTNAQVLALNDAKIAVEGGRLTANVTWESNVVHVVRNTVVVPSGITLTVLTNAVVKFCENTGVKVEAGGSLIVIGSKDEPAIFTPLADDTAGGDTDKRKTPVRHGEYVIDVVSGGTFSDSYAAFRHIVVPAHATLSLPEKCEINESEKQVQIPVTLSGSRTTPFRAFWRVIDGTAKYPDDFPTRTGVVEWNSTSDGTRFITVPVNDDGEEEETENFTVELYDAQGANISASAYACVVTVRDSTATAVPYPTCAESPASEAIRLDNRSEGMLGKAVVKGVEYRAAGTDVAAIAWDTTAEPEGWQTLTASDVPALTAQVLVRNDAKIAVEGGRLTASTVWDSNLVHLVRHTVVVPSGVTLSVTTNAVVKFCENTGVKVEAGGRFQLLGSLDENVYMTLANDDTVGGDTDKDEEREWMEGSATYSINVVSGGTFTDMNSVIRGTTIGTFGYASVNAKTVVDATEGVIRIPVFVNGSRTTQFSVDWKTSDGHHGQLVWGNVNEGTKWVTLNVADCSEKFTFELCECRGINIDGSAKASEVSVFRNTTPLAVSAESESSAAVRFENRADGTFGKALCFGREWKSADGDSRAEAWDTTQEPNDWIDLGEGMKLLVRNDADLAVEGGRLMPTYDVVNTNGVEVTNWNYSVNWTSDKVHIVRNWVVVPNGMTLSIAVGTVVKFAEFTGFKVEAGGRLYVEGTVDAPVVYTAAADDTIGGDTDKREVEPQYGDYSMNVISGGTYSDRNCAIRYATFSNLGTATLPASAVANEKDGVVRVPMFISTSRTTAFCVDWRVASGTYATKGRLNWNTYSEGTKYIEIPLTPGTVKGEFDTFEIEMYESQGINVSTTERKCVVTIYPDKTFPEEIAFADSVESAAVRMEDRDPLWSYGAEIVCGTELKSANGESHAEPWDTTQESEGWVEVTDGTEKLQLLVRNDESVAVEGGRLNGSTTWGKDKVHIVRNWVVVPNGVTLTIAAGTVVKFCDETGIKVEAGGRLVSSGTSAADVILTSINDDTVGGDTDFDEVEADHGDYRIDVVSGGTFTDTYTQMRYGESGTFGSVSIASDVVAKKDGGIVRIPLTISASRTTPFSVDWVAHDGTAIYGEDYLCASGRIDWTSSSQGTKYLEIPLDRLSPTAEDEWFEVELITGLGINLNLNSTLCLVDLYDSREALVGDNEGYAESAWSEFAAMDSDAGREPKFVVEDETLTYSTDWATNGAVSVVAITDAENNAKVLHDADAPAEGAFVWSPEGYEDGRYDLTHRITDDEGRAIKTDYVTFIINRDVMTHGGRLTADETWGADKVHLVKATVHVPSGVTLTIAPDAIVKFMPGTEIVVEAGGLGICRGAIITHAYDDAMGGDTFFDGGDTIPSDGAYKLTGDWEDDETTQYHYVAPIEVGGIIRESQRWPGYKTYKVKSSITLQSGVTLDIEPGAVIKFGNGMSFTVNSGATLNAQGTRSAPIVFTSIKDDDFGGDTNGDGGSSIPMAGDWVRIYAGGTLNMNYCRVRYCNNNSDQGAIQGTGGTVNFDNGIIEASVYECVRMNSGKFVSHNSIFRDASMGFGYYGGSGVYIYNGIVADCTTACRASNKHFYNTVFYRCRTFLESTASSCDHCVFYNPEGYGAQSAVQVGSSGNIWGDPGFADADAGDYRITEKSICVDAGNGSVSGERDFYNQPRRNVATVTPTGVADAEGNYPDIGIYEVQPRFATSDIDLAMKTVSVPAAMSVGDVVEVSWRVSNLGTVNAEGPWSDKVEIISGSGEVTLLGTYLVKGGIAAGGERLVSSSFRVPSAAEGECRIRVTTNYARDLYEGSQTANNVMYADVNPVISIPTAEMSAGEAARLRLIPGQSASYALDGIPAEGGAIALRLAEGVSCEALVSFGKLPTSYAHASAMTVLPDGRILISIPPNTNGETVYLSLIADEDVTNTGVIAELLEEYPAIYSVSKVVMPNIGKQSLTVTGVGLDEIAGLSLVSGDKVIVGESLRVANAGEASATFDLTGAKLGDYSVVGISGSGKEIVAPEPVSVILREGAKANLEVSLQAPTAIRANRWYEAIVTVKNTGDADAEVPIVVLNGEGLEFKDPDGGDGLFKGVIQLLSLSQTGNPLIVEPEEMINIGVSFRSTTSSRSAISIGLLQPAEVGWTSFISRGNLTDSEWDVALAAYAEGFSSAIDFLAAVYSKAALFSAGGYNPKNAFRLYKLVQNEKASSSRSGMVSGFVVDEEGHPVPGLQIGVGSIEDSDTVYATTDKNGFFAAYGIKEGSIGFTCEDYALEPEENVDLSSSSCVKAKLVCYERTEIENPMALRTYAQYNKMVKVLGDDASFAWIDEYKRLTVGNPFNSKSCIRLCGGAYVESFCVCPASQDEIVIAILISTGEKKQLRLLTVEKNMDGIFQEKDNRLISEGALNVADLCVGNNDVEIVGLVGDKDENRFSYEVFRALRTNSNRYSMKAAPVLNEEWMPGDSDENVDLGINSDWMLGIDLKCFGGGISLGPITDTGVANIGCCKWHRESTWGVAAGAEFGVDWRLVVNASGGQDRRWAYYCQKAMGLGGSCNEKDMCLTGKSEKGHINLEGGGKYVFPLSTETLVKKLKGDLYKTGRKLPIILNVDASVTLTGGWSHDLRERHVPRHDGSIADFYTVDDDYAIKLMFKGSAAADFGVPEFEGGGGRGRTKRPGSVLYSKGTEDLALCANASVDCQIQYDRHYRNNKLRSQNWSASGGYDIRVLNLDAHARLMWDQRKGFYFEPPTIQKHDVSYLNPFAKKASGVSSKLRYAGSDTFFGSLRVSDDLTLGVWGLRKCATLGGYMGCREYILDGRIRGGLFVMTEDDLTRETRISPDEFDVVWCSRMVSFNESNSVYFLATTPDFTGDAEDLLSSYAQKRLYRVDHTNGVWGKPVPLGSDGWVQDGVVLSQMRSGQVAIGFKSSNALQEAEVPIEKIVVAVDDEQHEVKFFDVANVSGVSISSLVVFDKDNSWNMMYSKMGDGEDRLVCMQQEGDAWVKCAEQKEEHVENHENTPKSEKSRKIVLSASGSCSSCTKGCHCHCNDNEPEPQDGCGCRVHCPCMGLCSLGRCKCWSQKYDLDKPQSSDPNEMAGPEGKGNARCVRDGDWMDYTIYFENRAEATAAAQDIFVTLPKDPELDWTTFELGEIAFGENIDTGLSGKSKGECSYALPGTTWSVRTIVTHTDEAVKWHLRVIDPSTPDNYPEDQYAGFLQPNDGTGRGEGHLRYRVKVRKNATVGSVIRASATIVFDTNDPIETKPAWWNTVGQTRKIVVSVDGVESEIEVFEGEAFGELPDPGAPPENCAFDGWYTKPGGNGRRINALTTVEAEIEAIYAHWLPYVVEMDGVKYTSLADAAKKCPYNASSTNEIKILSDFGAPDDWAFCDGQKVAVDLNGHRSTNVWLQVDSAELIIRDMSEAKTGAVELQVAADLSYGGLTLESGKLVAGLIERDRAIVLVCDTAGRFDFLGGEIVAREGLATVYVSNGCIRVGGHAVATNAGCNVVLDLGASLELAAPLTGRIGITTDNDVEGAAIGLNPSGFAGAENLYCDRDPMLRGRTTEEGLIVWERAETSDGGSVVAFDAGELTVDEGGTLKVVVSGGNMETASSVQVAVQYNTAAAADLDLKNAAVNGAKPKSFKFPVTLEWAAGEIGEKTIEIPVVVDKAVEADEFLTLQLLNPMNLEIGEASACTVTIRDPQFGALKSAVESGTATKAQSNDLQKIEKALAGKSYVRALANDATRGKVTGSALAADGKNVSLKATANKGWVFAGWYTDLACTAGHELIGYGDYRNPSLAYPNINGAVTVYARFIMPEEDDLELGEDFLPAEFAVNEAVSISVPVESVSYPTVTVSGLPSGLKYYAKETLVKATKTTGAYTIPANTIFGTPTKATTKPAMVTVTVKNLGGYQIVRKYEVSVVATEPSPAKAKVLSDAPHYYSVAIDLSDDFAGKVTGAGVYQVGKTVTLKATANKGYVFSGWYDGDALVSRLVSYVLTMPSEDVAYVAKFVTAEEDAASIGTTVANFAFGAAAESGGSTGNATNVMCGVYLEWPVAASALSETTVAVAGLPSGLKFTAKPVTTKVTSGTGKTAVTVTNVPPNTIYGAPTAASKTDKYGVVTPSKVKVTVTTAGKSKAEYVIDLTVDPLPAWAQGEFSGLASTPEGRLGGASMSVTAAGKVAGKVIVNGTNCTFTAANYDITSKTVGETNLVAVVTGKLGKEAVTGGITVVASGASGSFAGAEMALSRNVWKDKGADPVPADAQGLYTVKLGAGERGTGYLSLTVDKKGAVKVAGKAPDGTALSASATLMPDGNGAYFADLFAAPSAYKGGYVAGRLGWDADGKVSSDGLDWTSFNPQSTGDYEKGGFDRALDCSGAKYDKTASLKDGYDTLRMSALGVGEELFITVDQTGKKFVVVDKGDAKLTFTFTQTTGIWQGTLLWDFGDPSLKPVKVSFEGVMVQGEDLEGFGTYDVSASYVPYDKNGNPQKTKTYKYKESVPVGFINGNKDI